MSLDRVTITIPRELVAAADHLARRQDRSRSWVISDLLRRSVALLPTDAPRLSPTIVTRRRNARSTQTSTNSDSARPPLIEGSIGLGASRLAQLRRDLALTPEQRVLEAEDTARTSERRAIRGVPEVIAFNQYEEFLDWQLRQRAGA